MKTVYVPKKFPDGYVEFPVPTDLKDYYSVSVPDDFTLRDYVFDKKRRKFVERPENLEYGVV
ncbi:hypothetical protein NMD64_08130 [Edwardsiella tarda]|uniref:hypothetical protein n=1 Tax=Edwardsiella tarda TaxID=636 RepID=UPI00351CB2E3